MAVGSATLVLDQAVETPVQRVQGEAFAWSWAYSRAAETRAAGALGQDRLVLRHDRSALAFALCDGVSQSFFGDLAARVLADGLVDWLWNEAPLTTSGDILAPALNAYLDALTHAATEQVRDHALPPDLSHWVQEVLERKRNHGSESTFVCGRIDRPGPALPAGRVVAAWLGDSRLRLWGPDGERTAELGDTFHTAQRWSTLRGALGGPPHLFVTPLLRDDGTPLVTSLIAYSDGLATLDRLPAIPGEDTLAEMISQAGETAASDDISLLALAEIVPWSAAAALPARPAPGTVPAPLPADVLAETPGGKNGSGPHDGRVEGEQRPAPEAGAGRPMTPPEPAAPAAPETGAPGAKSPAGGPPLMAPAVQAGQGETAAAASHQPDRARPAPAWPAGAALAPAPDLPAAAASAGQGQPAAGWRRFQDWLPYLAFGAVFVAAAVLFFLPGGPLRGSGVNDPAEATRAAGTPAKGAAPGGTSSATPSPTTTPSATPSPLPTPSATPSPPATPSAALSPSLRAPLQRAPAPDPPNER